MQNKLAILIKKFQEPYIRLAKALQCPIFYHEKPVISTTEISLLPAKEGWSYDADFLAFDLWSINALLEWPRCINIYGFINPNSWKGEFAFESLHYILMSKQVRLIAGNQEEANVIENTWKKPFAIAENFHLDQIKEIVCPTKTSK